MDNLAAVTGRSQVLGIIGNPVSHSLSPVIHNTLANRLGVPFIYVPFPVVPEKVQEAITGCFALGVWGCNVTAPYKQAVLPFLTHLDPVAERIGAVNTIHFTNDGSLGYNTDIEGVRRALLTQSVSLKGKSVLLLGAGGAAKACAVLAGEEHAAKLTVVNRTPEKAYALASQLGKWYPLLIEVLTQVDASSRYDIVFQTTTAGMEGNPAALPMDNLDFLQHAELVMDCIYAPWETLFLQKAKQLGLKTLNGFPMLFYQAAAAFEIWYGQAIDLAIQQEVLSQVLDYCKQSIKI